MSYFTPKSLRTFVLAMAAAGAIAGPTTADGFRIKPGSSVRVEPGAGQTLLRVSSDDNRVVTFVPSSKGWTVTVLNGGKADLTFNVPAPHSDKPSLFTLNTPQGQKVYYLSQHLFNDDDKFEVIFGNEVYNQDGTHLGHIPTLSATENDDSLLLGNSSVMTEATPEDVSVDMLNAMFDQAKGLFRTSTASHYDFGLPALLIALDAHSADVNSVWSMNAGYDWFATFAAPALNPELPPARFLTLIPEQHVASANAILAGINGHEGATTDFVKAQAQAWRAYNNFLMIQMRQFTYAGHEDLPGIPLVTENNHLAMLTEGAPVSTVREVYDAIMADLMSAAALLRDVDPSDFMPDRPKTTLNRAAVYGLIARVKLVMQHWSEALLYAQKALDESGATPLSYKEAATDTFSDINSHSWLWGIQMGDDEATTSGLLNFRSHMAFSDFGYYNLAPRRLHHALARTITDTDVRKLWWADLKGRSERFSDERIRTYIADSRKNGVFSLKDTGVKFTAEHPDSVRTDVPLMRAEEMYLIMAEAAIRQGLTAEAADRLTQFVATYRDPEFVAPTTAPEIADEISRQRRLELWGEGMRWFDIMRADNGFSSQGACLRPSGTDTWHYYIVPKDHQAMLIPIGKWAWDNNKGYTESDFPEFVDITPTIDTTEYYFPMAQPPVEAPYGYSLLAEDALYLHRNAAYNGSSEEINVFYKNEPDESDAATLEIHNVLGVMRAHVRNVDNRYYCTLDTLDSGIDASGSNGPVRLFLTDTYTYISEYTSQPATLEDHAGQYDTTTGKLILPIIFFAPGEGKIQPDKADTLDLPQLKHILN